MAAIRTEFIPLGAILQAGEKKPYVLKLDCWRITIFMWGSGPLDTVNGAANNLTGFLGGQIAPPSQVFQLGGLVVDGRPVYLNDEWIIKPDQTGGNGPFQGFVVKEYYDVNTPEPGT